MNRREKSDNINGWLGYFSAYGVKPGHGAVGSTFIPSAEDTDSHPLVMAGLDVQFGNMTDTCSET